MAAGVLLGLTAALCQSLSYVGSRWFLVSRPGGVAALFPASHFVMAVLSLFALPFLRWSEMPEPGRYIVPLCGAAGFYLAGQASLFAALKRVESSRIAPLLGLKIVVLAGIATLFLHESLAMRQWIAVAMCASAAAILGISGGAAPFVSMAWLFGACVWYSLSDLSIALLIRRLEPLQLADASVAGVAMSYLLCGVSVLPVVLLRSGCRSFWADTAASIPYSVMWLLGMVFLYACFGAVGAVYGNILQSTRGIMSVAIGAAVARLGFTGIERRAGPAVWLGRLAAAGLMTAAIWVFHSASRG